MTDEALLEALRRAAASLRADGHTPPDWPNEPRCSGCGGFAASADCQCP